MGAKGSSEDGKRSRAKGVGFERQMARTFEAWWGAPCKRTPLSGAYESEWDLNGDLMFQKREGVVFPFLVELKKRENWRLEQLLFGQGPVLGWAASAAGEARMAGLRPLLVVARNRVAPLVFLPAAVADELALPAAPCVVVEVSGVRWVSVSLEVYLQTVPASLVAEKAATHWKQLSTHEVRF